MPNASAIRDAQALKLAFAGLGVHSITISQRSAARAGRALLILKHVVHGRAPKLFGVLRLNRVESLLSSLVIEIENLSVSDDRRCEPLSHLQTPKDLRL